MKSGNEDWNKNQETSKKGNQNWDDKGEKNNPQKKTPNPNTTPQPKSDGPASETDEEKKSSL